MSDLEGLLSLPTNWEDRPSAWGRVVEGDTLYRTLQGTIKAPAACDWKSVWLLLTRWRDEHLRYVIPATRQRRLLDQWENARRLIWCGEQAASFPNRFGAELDRVTFQGSWSTLPDFIEPFSTWAWGAGRSLLGHEIRGRLVEVPVALSDERKGDGFVASLHLEVLEGGSGALFHHPCDTFEAGFDSGFLESMQDAWDAARAEVPQDDPDLLRCDGRWRLPRDGRPLYQVKGKSASFAAMRGWWHAIQRMVPDCRVIALVQVARKVSPSAPGPRFALDRVGDLEQKVRAVAADTRFEIDRIVVFDPDEKSHAERALSRAGRGQDIEVVCRDAREP